MSRVFKWILRLAAILVAATLLVLIVEPSSPLVVPLVIAEAVAFLVLTWMIFAKAWRTKGWSIRHPGRFDETTPLK